MIQIQLQKFEGPLALLLYLIRKEEMDIFDIPIHEITKQYLDFIRLMQELDLEVAGEFIAMASTLIHIKSRMLLPQYDENGEVVEQADPRKELVQRLLEYQKYQEAAHKLYERPLLNRDIWARGVREKLEIKEDEILLEENALFALISAYRGAMRSIKKRVHQVSAKAQSIASRISEMRARMVLGLRIAMSEFIDAALIDPEDRKKQILITFLSILELGKMGFVSIYQTETFSEIYVEAKKDVDNDALSSVEEYDSMRADDVAEAMMAKAQKIQDFDDDFDRDEALLEGAEGEQLALSTSDVAGEITDIIADDVAINDIATDEEILAAEMEDLKGNSQDGEQTQA